jgi:hypothetical protein
VGGTRRAGEGVISKLQLLQTTYPKPTPLLC